MDKIVELIIASTNQVFISFTHNWPFLLISILVASWLKLNARPEKVTEFLARHKNAGIFGATAAAVGTPFCSCGTTAVILGMMASTIPWAPIVAFMVSSPLTSPEELIYSAGLFGWPFAITFFLSSIFLGLAGGAVASILESIGLLKNQSRFENNIRSISENSYPPNQSIEVNNLAFVAIPANQTLVQPTAVCGCSENPKTVIEPVALSMAEIEMTTCACNYNSNDTDKQTNRIIEFVTECLSNGKKFFPMFLGFAFIGYFINGLIPDEWVKTLFGSGNLLSIPLAATLGLPLYISSEGSLPLVRSMIDGGMNQGAAMAFLITGSGTSIGAVTGALTIARWRILLLVVTTLWVGAIITGFIFNLIIGL